MADNLIRRAIRCIGPISVNHFMKMALASPSTGYYRVNVLIGSGGDFITSPEINSSFGTVIYPKCTLDNRQLDDEEKRW